MRLPRPHHMFRKVIRLNRREYTVERPVGSTSGERNSFGGTPSEGEPDEFKQLLWLYDPQHGYVQEQFGVQEQGDLSGVAVPNQFQRAEPSFDLQENDRVEHGGNKYAVETVTYLPNEEDRQIAIIEFTKMEYEP